MPVPVIILSDFGGSRNLSKAKGREQWLRVPQPPFRRFAYYNLHRTTDVPLPEALEGKRSKPLPEADIEVLEMLSKPP